jgi:hypothetical protein
MIFVFPMAGESRRFAHAGYVRPKFQLVIHGAPLFDHAVAGFSAYFRNDRFLFVTRDADGSDFAAERCLSLGLAHWEIVTLAGGTSGQAETVMAGLEKAGIGDEQAIIIFNIDTVRPGYRKPGPVADPSCAGYLEVFNGVGHGGEPNAGSAWSYVAEDPLVPGTVAAVAEKLAISDLCCTGLYYFRKVGDFRWAYRHPAPPRSDAERAERYVAPLYNALIARGDRIALSVIASSEMVCCGTPEEYQVAQVSDEIGRRLRP